MAMIRPMLAAKFERERTALHLQQDGYLFFQPKIDGMRQMSLGGQARSRSGKLLPNNALQAWNKCYSETLHGLDAEVVPGHVYDPNVFRQAMSDIRAAGGSEKFTVYAFDLCDEENAKYGYEHRIKMVEKVIETLGETQIWHEGSHVFDAKLVLCPTKVVKSLEEIDEAEAEALAQGWEGGILRRPGLRYKYNRATALGGELTKLKRFEDEEAIIVGVEPWYTNENEATTSPLGFTQRSSHLAGQRALERVGAFRVQLLRNRGVEFNIGVFRGLSHADRDRLWLERDGLIGRIVTFKHQGYGGGYDVPRTPVLLGFRDPVDL